MKICCLFGHRLVFNEKIVRERLKKVLKECILNGYESFMLGNHGQFDGLAYSVLLELRKEFNHIKICVVFANQTLLGSQDKKGWIAVCYENVETSSYDLEGVYFKDRITQTNRKMIDDSQLIICFYDPYGNSVGVKNAVEYAKKKNKEIRNIFTEKEYKNFKIEREKSFFLFNKTRN